MKILLAVNHPAQFHLFKNAYAVLKNKGHKVVFVIKNKDILVDLMQSEGVVFHKLTQKRVGKGKFLILAKGFLDLIIQDVNLFKFVRKFKPDIMVGTDYSITHVGKLFNIPSIVFNEDDFAINKFFCKLAYPLASCIVSPSVCDVGKYYSKKISYLGFQKLSYLHPAVFSPDINIVKQYNPVPEKFFLIRLVSFSAGHDIEMEHGGFDKESLMSLIHLLEPHGKVFITSESKIPPALSSYQLKIDVKHIHHLMSFASLFIADSQSMIVEAAMLGTPSIRFNSFVGKISVLEELEQKYELTIGIHNSRPDLLLKKVAELLAVPNLQESYARRRETMLADKINLNAFMTWFIENYPESKKLIHENANYQYNFK